MSKLLKDKRALVSGGSRGIGANVAFTHASSPDQANAVSQGALALGVQALAIRADSADPAAVEYTVAQLGRHDILVNNGVTLVIGPIEDIKLADFDRTIAVNVRAVFVGHAYRLAARHSCGSDNPAPAA